MEETAGYNLLSCTFRIILLVHYEHKVSKKEFRFRLTFRKRIQFTRTFLSRTCSVFMVFNYLVERTRTAIQKKHVQLNVSDSQTHIPLAAFLTTAD
jgi:hypothetical protein